jgi:hypothetical protein
VARVDYELAFHRLGEYVASKTQHGREGLLVEMQKIAAECRIPEGDLARLLRLYGVEVNSAHNPRDEDDPSAADSIRAGTPPSPDIIDRGGHDGSSNRSTEAAAVR